MFSIWQSSNRVVHPVSFDAPFRVEAGDFMGFWSGNDESVVLRRMRDPSAGHDRYFNGWRPMGRNLPFLDGERPKTKKIEYRPGSPMPLARLVLTHWEVGLDRSVARGGAHTCVPAASTRRCGPQNLVPVWEPRVHFPASNIQRTQLHASFLGFGYFGGWCGLIASRRSVHLLCCGLRRARHCCRPERGLQPLAELHCEPRLCSGVAVRRGRRKDHGGVRSTPKHQFLLLLRGGVVLSPPLLTYRDASIAPSG